MGLLNTAKLPKRWCAAAAGVGAGESIKAEEAGAVAVPTTAAQEASLSLIAKKQSAADFNAEEAPMSSYVLNGVDYTAARSVKVRTTLPEWPFTFSRQRRIEWAMVGVHL